MHINYPEIRAINIESVIHHYGWEHRRQGNTLVLKKCPLPSHTSSDVYTFKASIVENLWTCHSQSCRKGMGKKGGDVIDLVCKIDGIQPLDAAKKLAELSSRTLTTQETHGPHSEEMSRNSLTNKPLNFVLPFNPEHQMIQSRGISIETARSYGVGYYRSKQKTASMDDRIIFPLHEDGLLVGYIGRTCLEVSESNPKWKMGKGIVKSMLFGLDRCDPAQILVITESPWAVLWLRERGMNAASLLGKELTEGQEKAIAPFRMLSLALDNDDAGREATEKISIRLRGSHAVKRSYFRE